MAVLNICGLSLCRSLIACKGVLPGRADFVERLVGFGGILMITGLISWCNLWLCRFSALR